MAESPTAREAIAEAIGSMWITTWHRDEADGIERPMISAKRPEDIADALLLWLRGLSLADLAVLVRGLGHDVKVGVVYDPDPTDDAWIVGPASHAQPPHVGDVLVVSAKDKEGSDDDG